jgi:flagellar basal body rod protein FlgG
VIKGLYAAASAMLANLTRQARLTHNLANLDTPGFRQVLGGMEDFRNAEVLTTPGRPLAERPTRLGQLGLGVEASLAETDFAQGGLRATHSPLDFAIMGDGFFRVQTPAGERFTRDGRFVRDASGALVTVDGFAVLNEAGAPIRLGEGQVGALADGTLTVDGQAAAQLGLAVFADPAASLTRDETLGNLFVAAGAPGTGQAGSLVQGHLEMANVNPAQAMTQMVAVGRAYEAAQRLVQTNDELLGRAIQSLGSW